MPVEWGKKTCVLLVFAESECRAEDIDDKHYWNNDVSYETSEGWVHFANGKYTNRL